MIEKLKCTTLIPSTFCFYLVAAILEEQNLIGNQLLAELLRVYDQINLKL